MHLILVQLRMRWVGLFVVLLFSLLIRILVFPVNVVNDQWKWEKHTADFVDQANTLGATLPPGGVGFIKLSPCEVDELLLVPAYCTIEQLRKCLLGLPAQLIDYLFDISNDDRIAPALVWIHEDKVISINRAKFTTGVNFKLKSWKVNACRDIKVIKEKSSPNGFLSISFAEK